ncbi:hypothetical protein GCM10027430_23200 [Lysobacter tyrosinilyticus]
MFACALLLLAKQSQAGGIAARRWLMASCAAGFVVAASKIAFYGWGTGVKAWDLAMPSGHATMAFALWPVLLTTLVPVERRSWRHLATALGITLGIACAWSRVALRAHPLSEAIVGSVLGLAAMAVVLPSIKALRLGPSHRFVAVAVLVALLASAVPYSLNIPTEAWLARSGAWLAGRPAPVVRKDWRGDAAFPLFVEDRGSRKAD